MELETNSQLTHLYTRSGIGQDSNIAGVVVGGVFVYSVDMKVIVYRFELGNVNGVEKGEDRLPDARNSSKNPL